jgi:hypothetical protein
MQVRQDDRRPEGSAYTHGAPPIARHSAHAVVAAPCNVRWMSLIGPLALVDDAGFEIHQFHDYSFTRRNHRCASRTRPSCAAGRVLPSGR